MATFHPNPNDDSEPWMERAALSGHPFRVWHVGMFCLAGFVAAVILICCCVKLRIPRTKQEIEANYRRKKLVSKFKARIKLIQNQDMDDLDLKKAMDIIQEDYKTESRHIELLSAHCSTADVSGTKNSLGRRGINSLLSLMKLGRGHVHVHPS